MSIPLPLFDYLHIFLANVFLYLLSLDLDFIQCEANNWFLDSNFSSSAPLCYSSSFELLVFSSPCYGSTDFVWFCLILVKVHWLLVNVEIDPSISSNKFNSPTRIDFLFGELALLSSDNHYEYLYLIFKFKIKLIIIHHWLDLLDYSRQLAISLKCLKSMPKVTEIQLLSLCANAFSLISYIGCV